MDATKTIGQRNWFLRGELSAVSLSDSAAMMALKEGEDIGVRDYRRRVSELDPETQGFVQTCLAEQEKTHGTLERLTHPHAR